MLPSHARLLLCHLANDLVKISVHIYAVYYILLKPYPGTYSYLFLKRSHQCGRGP